MNAIIPIVISSISLALAVIAVGINAYTQVWRNILKPFRLECVMQGVVWRPSINPPATPFSLLASVVVRNRGARPGAINGAIVRLYNPASRQELRLEAIVEVDIPTDLRLSDADDKEYRRELFADPERSPVISTQVDISRDVNHRRASRWRRHRATRRSRTKRIPNRRALRRCARPVPRAAIGCPARCG